MYAIHICQIDLNGMYNGGINGYFKATKIIRNGLSRYIYGVGKEILGNLLVPVVTDTPEKTYKNVNNAVSSARLLPEKLKIYMGVAPDRFRPNIELMNSDYVCMYRIQVVDLETGQVTRIFPE